MEKITNKIADNNTISNDAKNAKNEFECVEIASAVAFLVLNAPYKISLLVLLVVRIV